MNFDRDATRTQEHDGTVVQDGVLHLDATPKAASVARRFLEQHRDHLPVELLNDAELVVTEVVTNAVKYGRAGIMLRVRAEPPRIGIAVCDGGPPIPDAAIRLTTPADITSTGGRGLLIVDALASHWGVVDHATPPGKTVWIELTHDS